MTANRELAKQRNITEQNIAYIDEMHSLLEKLIESYTLEIPYEEALELVHSAEFTLQELWGFPKNASYHTWYKKLNEKAFCLTWQGRKFKCLDTGEVVELQ